MTLPSLTARATKAPPSVAVPGWPLSLNQPALLEVLDRLIGNLQSYREVLATGDRKALADKLAFSAARKRQMDLPGPDLLE